MAISDEIVPWKGWTPLSSSSVVGDGRVLDNKGQKVGPGKKIAEICDGNKL